jgi:predicted amidophosphoribosyltransferase
MLYKGTGRRLAMTLKHGDRLDVAGPLAQYMFRSGRELVEAADAILPVPLHWTRLIRRRYNQAAVLGARLSKFSNVPLHPDALRRVRATPSLDGLSRDARFDTMRDCIAPGRFRGLEGKKLLLVDDVLTSGATLSAASEACFEAGAGRVDILVLARVDRAGGDAYMADE